MSDEQAAPTHSLVSTQIEGGLCQIAISRPARRNALTMAMFAALADAFHEASTEPAVRAILVAGAGGTFTAGHDLDAFAEWPQGDSDPVPRFLHTLAAVEKPLVLAVDGVAMGIGVTMLLHADWSCCAPDTRMRLPFVDLGIGPEAASSELLTRAVGLVRAKQLLLSGAEFSGRDAYAWGLTTELAESTQVWDTARQRAQQLADKPPHAVAQMKRWLMGTSLAARIDEEIAFMNRHLVTHDQRQP